MRLVIAAMFAFSLVAGFPTAAFDLTGTWEGSRSCSEFDDGLKGKFDSPSTLVVTSLGDDTFRGVINGIIHVRGIQSADLVKPEKGEIGFARCGTNDDLAGQDDSEVGRLRVSTSGEGGTLSGISIFSQHATHIGTCTYKYKRVDTVDPSLTYPCP